MIAKQNYKIGILAFGSLIDNSGREIQELEIDRVKSDTPFKVEYARISSSRDNAPTLIPVSDESKGKKVNAVIIILKDNTTIEDAKSILWRRECHYKDRTKTYTRPKNPTPRQVLIEHKDNFMGVEKVLYTSFIQQPEYKNLIPDILADFAISSILSEAGITEKDGIRYLLSANKNGITTELSNDYEKAIQNKTNTNSLDEAIEKLDRKRKMYPDK